MGFPVSEAYNLPTNAKFVLGSVMANLCGSHYPIHMAVVEASTQRVLIDKTFSVLRSVYDWHECHTTLTSCCRRF